ncbi:alpha/beta hydrolase [Neisseriaceae bacterium TC5R-5]|nr:alpha/beta hydrolase [Neisseriaceae bacterium TC5R-5]
MSIRLSSGTHRVTLNQHAYQLRHWGDPNAPLLLMLHGWMDSSATFQLLVDALPEQWHIVAPDWRGFGDSAWNHGNYYAADYLADLDALLQHLSPQLPVNVLGHSMGAMITGIYAGVRPERVARLMLVEGFGLPATPATEAPARYARWLREMQQPPTFAPLLGLPEVASKLIERSPNLPLSAALWLAEQLTHCDDAGQLRYRADPRHKMSNPILYRLEEAKACWRQITAPVHWVLGTEEWDHPIASTVLNTLPERRACFKQLQETAISGAGHMVQWEQPLKLAEVVSRFFALR